MEEPKLKIFSLWPGDKIMNRSSNLELEFQSWEPDSVHKIINESSGRPFSYFRFSVRIVNFNPTYALCDIELAVVTQYTFNKLILDNIL